MSSTGKTDPECSGISVPELGPRTAPTFGWDPHGLDHMLFPHLQVLTKGKLLGLEQRQGRKQLLWMKEQLAVLGVKFSEH